MYLELECFLNAVRHCGFFLQITVVIFYFGVLFRYDIHSNSAHSHHLNELLPCEHKCDFIFYIAKYLKWEEFL